MYYLKQDKFKKARSQTLYFQSFGYLNLPNGKCTRLKGHEFEQTLGDIEGQGSLVCCSPRGRKESRHD